MNKNKIYQITSVVITLIGIGYMGQGVWFQKES